MTQLIVASEMSSPLCTDTSIPTDGQMQSCPHLEWVLPARDTEFTCCVDQAPFPFTVAVWREVVRCADCGTRDAEFDHNGCLEVVWTEPEINAGERCYGQRRVATGAIVELVEITGPSHHADDHPDDDADFPYLIDTRDHGWQCHEDALPDCFHTPTGQVTVLDQPIPCERPVGFEGPWVHADGDYINPAVRPSTRLSVWTADDALAAKLTKAV